MAESPDIFADGFRLFVGAFGGALHFHLSTADSHDTAALEPGLFATHRVATIRTTPEMMKALAFLLHAQVVQYERDGNLEVSLPPSMMENALKGTTRDAWDRFWGYT